VVSVYFTGKTGLDCLKNRESQLADVLSDDDLEAENFFRSMATIREILESKSVSHADGVCCFCSDVLEFAKVYPIDMEVPKRLVVGPAPFIRPLAELQDEYETFAMVVCDNTRTRILTVTNHTAEAEVAIKGGINNHVRKGGWSQQRYERRRDAQLQRYADDVADALNDLVSQEQLNRIVLIGSEETMQAIEDRSSDRITEKFVGREAFDLGQSENELVERAYEAYFDEERQNERDHWQRIKGETLRDGRATTNPEEVFEAAKIGQVEYAVIDRHLTRKATACRACENATAASDGRCPACGSEDVFPVDYCDSLARYLETTSATLDFVDSLKGLERVGGVAAMLRYKIEPHR
jgi:peptide subunit release factor 1 (eRF1)